VNDLKFEDALMRPCEEHPADFQLVVERRFLGSFALHEEFFLERRESGRLSGWRQVSLEELKLASLEASRNDGGVMKREVGRWEVSVLDVDANNTNIPRMPVEGDSSHIVRATEAFSRGGVRYKIVGGVGSRGQIWGHATFLVDSLQGARVFLWDAGFIPGPDLPQVLVDSRNGWKIRLLGEPQG
jgi:hypothetical protein